MPVAATTLDPLLLLIWRVTWLLACLALVLALAVVLRRYRQERAARRTAGNDRELVRLVLKALRDANWQSLLPVLSRQDPEALLVLVDELAQMVRGDVRERLAELARALGLERHLIEALGSWRAGVRAVAAARLALFHDAEAERALLAALADPDPSVRIAAAEGLAGRPAARQQLRQLALEDAAFATPAAARFWHLLAQLDAGLFTSCFRSVTDPARRCRVIEAAARAGLVGLAGDIAGACLDADPGVRRSAVGALLELHHPAALPALERLLLEPEPSLRAHALTMIADARLMRLAPQVLARLEDPDPLVRARARETALRLGLPMPAAATAPWSSSMESDP